MKMSYCREGTLTGRALEIFESFMDPSNVLGEILFFRIGSLAGRAFERFESFMDTMNVFVQVSFSREGSLTDRALKRSLASVSTMVLLQVPFRRKRLFTFKAEV